MFHLFREIKVPKKKDGDNGTKPLINRIIYAF